VQDLLGGVPACPHVVDDPMGHVLAPQEPDDVVGVGCGEYASLPPLLPPTVTDGPLQARGVGVR